MAPTLDQPELMRNLSRLLGTGPTPEMGYEVDLRAIVDAMDFVPLEVLDDLSTTTPAAGRLSRQTVPDNEMWRVWSVTSENNTTAVRHSISILPQKGGQRIRIMQDDVSVPAAVVKVASPPRPIPVWPGGTIDVSFGAGVLNDATEAKVLFQRFVL